VGCIQGRGDVVEPFDPEGAASIAYQIHRAKTRLTVIKGYAQMIEREFQRPNADLETAARYLQRLLDEVDRLVAFINRMEAAEAERRQPNGSHHENGDTNPRY
jgi:nitrogen-specific signal transduction histidine kinase